MPTLAVSPATAKAVKTNWRAKDGGYGRTSHGSTWCSSLSIVRRVLVELVDWELNAGLRSSFKHEMEDSGWRPRVEQIERWRLDVDNIVEHVEQLDADGKSGKP